MCFVKVPLKMKCRFEHLFLIFVVIQLYVTFVESNNIQKLECCEHRITIHCINKHVVRIGCKINCWPDLEHLLKKFCHDEIGGYVYSDSECKYCFGKANVVNEKGHNPASQPIPEFTKPLQAKKFTLTSARPTSTLKRKTLTSSQSISITRQQTIASKPTVRTTIKRSIKPSKNVNHSKTQPAVTKSTENHHNKEKSTNNSINLKSKNSVAKNSSSTSSLITFIVILLVINFILIGYNSKKLLKKIQQSFGNQNAESNGQIPSESPNQEIPSQLQTNPNVNSELNENRDPIYASLDWNR